MQPFASLLLAILILCALSTVSSVTTDAQGLVAHGGDPPISSSDTNSDPPRRPPAWRIHCRTRDKKDMKRKCRLISQCNNQGIMTSLSPECETKCFCVLGNGYNVIFGPNTGLPNNRDVGYQEMMRERHKKEEVNKAVEKEWSEALRQSLHRISGHLHCQGPLTVKTRRLRGGLNAARFIDKSLYGVLMRCVKTYIWLKLCHNISHLPTSVSYLSFSSSLRHLPIKLLLEYLVWLTIIERPKQKPVHYFLCQYCFACYFAAVQE
jgi:hypothetical protein